MSGFKDLQIALRGEDITSEPCLRCAHPMRNGYCYYCGSGQRPPGKSAERRARDEARALQLWDEAIPIVGTLAEHYLRHHRRITMLPPAVDEVLRFHPRCPFGTGRDDWHPAMLALLRQATDNRPCGVHRTPIDRTLGKIAKAKAYGTFGHTAIKLWPAPVAGKLTIGEGIETVLSAVELKPELAPAWAVGTANNVGMFPIIDEVEELHILADNDPPENGRIGPVKADQCAGRYSAFAKAGVIHTPRRHKDFNDILKELRHA